jgi:hypothetical protein
MSNVSFVLLFIIVYSIYHLTSFPSIPGGDSGELLAESCLLGTAHPPGYPIFTMLSHIVGKIPFYRIYLGIYLSIYLSIILTISLFIVSI